MALTENFEWRSRQVRWRRLGADRSGGGPAVVMCHGTPWSSWLWEPFAEAMSAYASVYLWDMPGYGASSKDPRHRVALDVQGELLADLVEYWGLVAPHVVAHDFGGAVALRAHLLHRMPVSSLALVDVVALRPWGSPFFRLVGEAADTFARLPDAVHAGALRSYIGTASQRGLRPEELDALVSPWLGEEGKAAFYRQIVQADEAFTDEIEPLYATIEVPTSIVWGAEDAWIPPDRGERLAKLIPGSELIVIPAAGHLIHLDQPVALATSLTAWLLRHR